MEQAATWFIAGFAVGLMVGIVIVVYITLKKGGP